MANVRAFKRYGAAKSAAAGAPMLRVGNTHLVIEGDALDIGLTEIALIAADGRITGCVTIRYLDRLGNANHAQAHCPYPETAFPNNG